MVFELGRPEVERTAGLAGFTFYECLARMKPYCRRPGSDRPGLQTNGGIDTDV